MKPIALTPAQLDAALGLPTLADWIAGRCFEAWHTDSTTGGEYGHCSRPAGHAGCHITDAGTRWGADAGGGCLWCGASTDLASFTVGGRRFCSGKCARYFETAPVTSAATFFEDARRHFGPPRPRLECTCAGRDYGLCPACAP